MYQISWVTCHRGSGGSSAIVPSQVFRASEIFFSGYFVRPKFFLVGISWVQNIFSCVFRRSNIFCAANFVIQRFSVVRCIRVTENRNT